MTTEIACPWVVWTYAIRDGWGKGLPWSTRDEAREVRAELIDNDGYPSEFVAVRHESQGAPQKRPPQAVIDQVKAELAAGADR